MSSTVALVDDHPVFREGLRHLLSSEPGLEVVGEAGDARGACALANTAKPSVIVIDVALPDGDGIAATQEILRNSPRTRVLALTMHTGEFFVSRAFSAGVSGYAIKTQAPEEIVGAVCAVARGETYVPARFSHLVTRPNGHPNVPTTPFEDLSKREREIFDLILRGFTNEGMARALFISVKTVETHRTQLMDRLDIHDIAGLVRYAIRMGVISPDG